MFQKLVLSGLILTIFLLFGCSALKKSSSGEDFSNINIKGENGSTPLIDAVKSQDLKRVTVLLSNGADIHLKDDNGKSALKYAFDSEQIDIFKILLENDSDVDFDLSEQSVLASSPKRKMVNLVREYEHLKQIKKSVVSDTLQVFDEYFSEFPEGLYWVEVEKIFEEIVIKTYQEAISRDKMMDFYNKFSNFGKKAYQITNDNLNIRIGNSTNTRIVGKYEKNDRIYARFQKGGWIQTDRGWIKRQYTRQIKPMIPIIQPYLQEISHKLNSVTRSQATPKNKGAASKSGLESIENDSIDTSTLSPPHVHQDKSVEERRDIKAVQEELAEIMKMPSIANLENFIQQYKDEESYHFLVDTAKQAYKKILLNE